MSNFLSSGLTIYGFSTKTITLMSFNFVSSIGIVFANKYVFHSHGYNYACFVTALHFIATTLGGRICLAAGLYTHKPLQHQDVFPITVAFCAFVVFNNLSLQYNSVGFYQLMKVLTTPVVVLLQRYIWGITLPFNLQCCLSFICAGVLLATVSDISLTFVGTFWAVAGLVATAFYQLLISQRQQALKCNALQLLHYQAPQSAALVLLMTPFLDKTVGVGGLFSYSYSFDAIFWIFVACVLAFCVNLSTFLVIGNTSPVSYQVLGHFKLVVILLAGVFIFGEDSNVVRLCGMTMAFCGIIGYTELKRLAVGVGVGANMKVEEGSEREEKEGLTANKL